MRPAVTVGAFAEGCRGRLFRTGARRAVCDCVRWHKFVIIYLRSSPGPACCEDFVNDGRGQTGRFWLIHSW